MYVHTYIHTWNEGLELKEHFILSSLVFYESLDRYYCLCRDTITLVDPRFIMKIQVVSPFSLDILGISRKNGYIPSIQLHVDLLSYKAS